MANNEFKNYPKFHRCNISFILKILKNYKSDDNYTLKLKKSSFFV